MHSTEFKTISATFIWLITVSFLLFQFFLQLSSGIVIGTIMHEQNLSAFSAGLLSSSFYYVYTVLQIPVGFLFDRYNTKYLLAVNAALCASGCLLFALATSLPLLFLGRLIIGAGSAFAFVGVTHILRQHFPIHRYAFMVGLSETLGFTITVGAMLGMGTFISLFGWRLFIAGAAMVGFIIAGLLWRLVPANAPIKKHTNYKKQFLLILKNKRAWCNGLFVGLEFSVITVFASLWAVPFLQLKLHCSLSTTSILTSMLLLGAGLSCPLFGLLATYLTKRRLLIHASCLTTAALLMLLVFAPIHNLLLIGLLMFAIGLCCGAYMLAFSISNELAPQYALSSCTGFTNTLAMISAPILQPLIGLVLDKIAVTPGHYSLSDYQTGLMIIPLGLVIAALLANALPEKQSQPTRVRRVDGMVAQLN